MFLDPRDEVGPSISSSVVLCFFVLFVYIVMLVLVVCLCPSSVHVVDTFPGTVLFPLLCSVLQFFCLIHWFFSLSSFVIPSTCLKNFICAASKRCSSLFFSTQASLPSCWWFLLESKSVEAVVIIGDLPHIRICPLPQYNSVVSTCSHRIMVKLQFWKGMCSGEDVRIRWRVPL